MTVMLAFPHNGWPRAEFMMSVVAQVQDDNSDVSMIFPFGSGPNLAGARSEIATRFLASDCEWLWMLDSDVVFTPLTLPALLTSADPAERPLVGAVCYGRDGRGDTYPCVYGTGEDTQGRFRFGPLTSLPESQLLKVSATGCGCLLAHRSVFDRITKHNPDDENLWFAEITVDGAVFSEDLSFCMRAAMAGIPVLVHTGIRVGHVKPVMLGTVTP